MSDIKKLASQLMKSSSQPSSSGRTQAEKLATIALLHGQVRAKLAQDTIQGMLQRPGVKAGLGAGAAAATAAGAGYLYGKRRGRQSENVRLHSEADKMHGQTGVRILPKEV